MEICRVLLLIDRLGRGGAAQVLLNVALALDRTEFSPIVCTTRRLPAYGQDEILRQASVPLIELNRQSRRELSSWVPLWRVLPTVSILHAHESGSNFWGRLWGRLFRVPIIITQDHTAADEKSRIVHLFDRAMSPLSDRIVTVSQFDRDLSIQFEKLSPDKVVTIYNGIDVARFACELAKREARRRAGLPKDKWLLAIIARLAPQKNHQGLFEALTLLPENLRSKSHCLVIGTGDLENQLRGDVHRLGLQESVSFLGERSDVPIILSAIDLLVLPSHWECLPIVILEALASRCPIVATAVGGVPEVLDGLGWPLVSPGDSNSLAEAMASILQMPEAERHRIAQAGRQTVMERFSKEASAAQVERLYHSLLASTIMK
jgi:glycosyltransferase involved in cell wall biosynthesis